MAPPSLILLTAVRGFLHVNGLQQVLFSKITGPIVSRISTVGELGLA
ncbi:Uncharacterised protein [Chlamydia trachomatis]|nr:Uncharacterised protein [Chlamydia trachomatis]CRH48084.1 Uncharacterised protein [Chlamydia trachomatis]